MDSFNWKVLTLLTAKEIFTLVSLTVDNKTIENIKGKITFLENNEDPSDIEEVVVYGKIPRSSISIPTITGGMYSPDFMYIVKKSNGKKEINIVVETKDVEGQVVLRGTESTKIECAKIFFEMLSKDGYTVHFRDQLNNKQMRQIINEVLNS